ncbi:hypothetical protein [Paractinoplanes rishiriensis]|uniref:Uncharacterized protein n=1 Tax=Paractinoplanes rishiriensis TaxID=1050105 RepID=A0A919K8M8_9ACTN|nr:hypothetical protein [Actinoplanes rishiriensis]GIF01745.1 hypothetical protein Ari01nite_92090 [Actinoplanes rishiriensis]
MSVRESVFVSDQRLQLISLTVQVKMSHDLTAAFLERYTVFPEEMLSAYARELVMIRAVLDRHGLVCLDGTLHAGRFTGQPDQERYARLLRRGFANRAAALDVVSEMLGETVAMIDSALPHLRTPDVRQAYLQLYAASMRQCRLLQAWARR